MLAHHPDDVGVGKAGADLLFFRLGRRRGRFGLWRGGPVGWRWYNPAAPIETVGSQLDVFGIWLEAVAAWYGAFAQLTGGAWRYRADQLQAYLSWLNQARFESQILSHEGPLAAGGPLNPERFGDADLLDQLNTPGGALAVSGPWGPLGALGPLGPLGPLSPLVAVQGYQNDAEGRFVPGVNGCFRPADDGEEAVCRTVLVPWEPQDEPCERRTANCRRYELYESYDEAFAQAFDDNDTSFMVIGRAAMSDEDDVYELTSRETQYVTVLLTPEEKPLIDATALQGLYIATGQLPGSPALFDRDLMLMPEALERMPGAWALFYDHATAFDDFDLTVEILDADGRPARRATSIMGGGRNMPDWIQVRVPAGTRLRVRVRLYARRVGIPGNPEFFTPSQADYRLFVTGSTARAPIGPSTGAPRVPLERLDAL